MKIHRCIHMEIKCMQHTVYPKKNAHGFVVLCFVVVMQSFIMNSLEVFIHIHQGCFAGTGAIVRLPQCQWSKPDGYGKISQCITTTKLSKAKTVCIFLGIYCICIIAPMCIELFNRNPLRFQIFQHYIQRYHAEGVIAITLGKLISKYEVWDSNIQWKIITSLTYTRE